MKSFSRQVQITVHLFLIFWGCGLGPLTYFERLSAHRGVQAGSFAVLGMHVGQNPALPPDIEAIVYRRSVSAPVQMLRRLQAKQDTSLITKSERSPLKTLLTALTSGQLLHTCCIPYTVLIIKSHGLRHQYLGDTSAYLSPPEKPPSRLVDNFALL
jgi:hypothetical protein